MEIFKHIHKNKSIRFLLPICALVLLLANGGIEAKAEGFSTYTYDFWGTPTPMPDAYRVTNFMLGEHFEIGHFLNPRGLHSHGDRLYVADTGNNRIVVLHVQANGDIVLDEVVDHIMINGIMSDFRQPMDIFVMDNGERVIADTENNRLLHVSENWTLINEINEPASVVQAGADFLPENVVVDRAGRIFVQARHINRGLMEFDHEGNFVGYMGANPVQVTPWDYFWRLIATQEQRARMVLEIPTEYNSVSMDHEGFIFVTNANPDGEMVRRLNSMGADVLIRNGHTDPEGDLWLGTAGNMTGPSRFIDVTTLPNGTFITFDQNRGRLFAYDFQGHLLYAFGGPGNREGNFVMPTALVSKGDTLFALDSQVGAITRFDLTEYGQLINNALAEYRRGNYEESAAYWQEVLRMNGNFEPAHIGIARSLLRQGYYRQAMEYFRLQNDRVGFGRAFSFYRREWVERHFWIFATAVSLLIVVPPIIKGVKNIRQEMRELSEEGTS